ncbi:membrane protein [Hylemonella gracilis str. Niagara R]|uniref:Membrane protein n=1 Tax=Hylemonella gracilis str. Niagara R TaxID=1458275 RepID=A0A016XED5_9BURK|nr:DMT family transporter [Hylemonella gracilis]EYC49937.1 membrane protein [Hylemonella gracilis str. Niagara R]
MQKKTTHLALAAACGAGFLWGTGALVVQVLIQRHGFTPENISFWRFVVGALVLLSVFGRPAQWPAFWRTLRPMLGTLLAAGAAMAGYVLLWFYGIERIGAAIPTLIALCLPPVLVTLVALARGEEQTSWPLLVLLTLSLLGTLLLVLPHEAGSDGAGASHVPDVMQLALGVGFAIGSALLYTGFTLVSGKLSNALGAGPATLGLTVVAAAVMGLSALHQPLQWPTDVPPQAWFLYLGIVTAALALLAFSWGAARLSPTLLTIAVLVEPLTTVLLAAWLLGEQLSLPQWLGGALLLTSIWGLGQRESRRKA